MNLVWAAWGAAAGLPAGSLLRATVYRLSVPAGQPERMACAHCGAPVHPWIAVACGHCGTRLGAAPMALELVTATVLALLLGKFGGQPEAVAFCFFGTLGVALAMVDIAVQRLPDRLTLPAYPVLIALLAVAAIAGHDQGAFVRALVSGVSLGSCYLLLALARPGGIGGGDVKLAGLAGLVLGWLGWSALVAGAVLGFVLSAVVSLALLAARRITLHGAISFGPFLLGGALIAMLTGGH